MHTLQALHCTAQAATDTSLYPPMPAPAAACNACTPIAGPSMPRHISHQCQPHSRFAVVHQPAVPLRLHRMKALILQHTQQRDSNVRQPLHPLHAPIACNHCMQSLHAYRCCSGAPERAWRLAMWQAPCASLCMQAGVGQQLLGRPWQATGPQMRRQLQLQNTAPKQQHA